MSWASLFSREHFLLFSSTATALFTLLTLWNGLVVQDSTARRVQALTAYRESLKAGVQTGRRHRTRASIGSTALPLITRAVAALDLMRGRQIERISLRLARAGWRSRDALAVYVFAKTVLPFVVGFGAILFFAFGAEPLKPAMRYGVLLGGFVLGLFGTDIFVRNAGDRRIHRMNNSLPDALDLLVVCAEGGLSLDAAITRVSREMMTQSPDLSDELSLTAVELGFLPNRQTALQNLTRRTDMPRLRSLVNSLAQTERYGTPLANTLRILAAEYRDERMMRAEEKAAKLPAILTVPMILFILPALFIVLCGPVGIRVADLMHGH